MPGAFKGRIGRGLLHRRVWFAFNRLPRHGARVPFHHFIHDSAGWTTLADETLFANPHLEVHRATVTSPTRPEPFEWTVTHRKAAVVVAPMTANGHFVLVRQERVAIRASIWEFP